MARYVRIRAKIEESMVRGEKVLEKADRLVERPALGSKKVKFSDAIRLYETAGEAFLAAGKWGRAALCFSRCAECELKLERVLEAANWYSMAGDYATRVDHTTAVRYYSLAVANWLKEGLFEQAAACERRLADVCEHDAAFTDAGTAYSYAAELYMTGDMHQQGALMYYTAGAAYVKGKQLKEAQRCFEQAASAADIDNMMRYRVPTMLFDACLCMLATGDVPSTEEQVLRYADAYPLFSMRRECRFMMDVIFAAKEMQHDAFIDHVWNFDYVRELQPFELMLLHRVHLMYLREKEVAEKARQEAEIASRKAALSRKREKAKEGKRGRSAARVSPARPASPAKAAGTGLTLTSKASV